MTPLGWLLLAGFGVAVAAFLIDAFLLGGLRFGRSDDPAADHFDAEWRRVRAAHEAHGQERDI